MSRHLGAYWTYPVQAYPAMGEDPSPWMYPQRQVGSATEVQFPDGSWKPTGSVDKGLGRAVKDNGCWVYFIGFVPRGTPVPKGEIVLTGGGGQEVSTGCNPSGSSPYLTYALAAGAGALAYLWYTGYFGKGKRR